MIGFGMGGGYPAQHPPSWARPEIVFPGVIALLVLYYAGRFWRRMRDSRPERDREGPVGAPEDEGDRGV